MQNYVCKHFRIEELIPPPAMLPVNLRAQYQRDPVSLFRCFPWALLVTVDRLRERYGSMTVNNWFWLGEEDPAARRFSGWRPDACTEGARLSEHRFFRAFDAKFKSVTPAEVWADMVKFPNSPEFKHLQRIEAFEGMTWFHGDLGYHRRIGLAIQVVTVKDNRAGLPVYIERGAAA